MIIDSKFKWGEIMFRRICKKHIALFAWWSGNGRCQELRIVFSFQIGLRSCPHLWSWVVWNGRKSALSGSSSKDESFTMNRRRDIRRRSAQLW